MSDDADHVVLTLPRGDRGELRLSRSRYEGHTFTKFHLWFPGADGALHPGRQVVTIRDYELAGVIAALGRIAAKIGPQEAPEPPSPRRRPQHRAAPRGGGAQPGTQKSPEQIAEAEAAF